MNRTPFSSNILVTATAAVLLSCSEGEATQPGGVAQVTVTPPSVTFQSLGDTVTLTAVAKDAAGREITRRTFAWSTSQITIATVSSTGHVRASSNGFATLTATTDGVSGQATVAVTQLPTSITFQDQPKITKFGVAMLPVSVALRDARGSIASNSTNTVSIGLATNPGNATLTGTVSRAAVAGIASFNDIAVSAPATGYRISASVAGMSTMTSNPFDIIDRLARFDSVRFASTTYVLGSLNFLRYTAWVTNAAGRPLLSAGVQGWMEQGTTVRAAGGTLAPNCGPPPATGAIAPGSCMILFDFIPAGAQPGAAVARLDLQEGVTVLDTVRVPITIQNSPSPATSSGGARRKRY